MSKISSATKESVLDAWAAGDSCGEIARRFSLNSHAMARVIIQRARAAGDLRARARAMGVTRAGGRTRTGRREIKFFTTEASWQYLSAVAHERELTAEELSKQLIDVICRDKMVAAVLDDGA